MRQRPFQHAQRRSIIGGAQVGLRQPVHGQPSSLIRGRNAGQILLKGIDGWIPRFGLQIDIAALIEIKRRVAINQLNERQIGAGMLGRFGCRRAPMLNGRVCIAGRGQRLPQPILNVGAVTGILGQGQNLFIRGGSAVKAFCVLKTGGGVFPQAHFGYRVWCGGGGLCISITSIAVIPQRHIVGGNLRLCYLGGGGVLCQKCLIHIDGILVAPQARERLGAQKQYFC